MKNGCNICGSGRYGLVKSELRDDKERFKVYRCAGCGHLFILPRPSAEEDNEFYDNNLQDRTRGKEIDFEKLKANNLFDTQRHVMLVKSLCGLERSVLDIGSGYGFFVNGLIEAGYRDVTGIEVSAERRELAMRHGKARIIDCDVNSHSPDIGRFGCVTLFHVLEHMADPVGFLRKIRGLMEDKGVFVCEVPNVRELLLDTCGPYNDFYWIRAHLNYFSSDTLLECMRRAGFNNVEIRFEQRYGLVNLCNWLTTGKPQIERPVFEINGEYRAVEAIYREYLEKQGRSDALIAVARA